MAHQKHKPWDRRSWVITPAKGDPIIIETTEGATWALRALISAGAEGLRPTDGHSGKFAGLVGKLRDLGLQIDDLPADEDTGLPGFRLSCRVAPAAATAS